MGQAEANVCHICFFPTSCICTLRDLLKDGVLLGKELVHLNFHLIESAGAHQQLRHLHLLLVHVSTLLASEARSALRFQLERFLQPVGFEEQLADFDELRMDIHDFTRCLCQSPNVIPGLSVDQS